jgi:hypothetical protein
MVRPDLHLPPSFLTWLSPDLAGGQIGWLGPVAKIAEALNHLRTEAACQGA